MAVSPKEKAALQEMWGNAKAPERVAQVEIPDGKYQFAIVGWKSNIDKHRIEVVYRVIGGNDELIGLEVPQYENLGTEQNIGFFKDKLLRLKVQEEKDPEDMDIDYVYGTGADSLKALMVGTTFEGQAKTKDGFVNVYANKLIERGVDVAGLPGGKGGEEGGEATETEQAATDLAEGDEVTFTSTKDGDLEGKITAVLADEGKVKVAANDKIYVLPIDRVTKKEAAAEETEEATETTETEETEETEPAAKANGNGKATNGNGHGFPKPIKVKALNASDLKKLLAANGVKAEAVRQPREFATAIAGFIHDPKYMPELSALAPLAAGLGVKYAKGEKPAKVVGLLRTAALKRFAKKN